MLDIGLGTEREAKEGNKAINGERKPRDERFRSPIKYKEARHGMHANQEAV
jgi:hypothetical protein